MEGKLTVDPVAEPSESRPSGFPYANWGPGTALVGFVSSLAAGAVFATAFSPLGVAAQQLGFELGFLLVPAAIALGFGAGSLSEALLRLGVRRFAPSGVKWMGVAIGAYLLFAVVYTVAFGEPNQEDIVDKLGPVPIQILLIVIAAPICEETCFRGMLFGGLRERLPRLAAALISGLIFGGLHATSGVSAVPPLIFFGFVLALLYEKTGSIVPGILLHMLNNSVALLGQ